MAQPVARIGDIGIGVCTCHKSPITVVGTIIIGSSDVFANNMGRARIGDTVMCSCGHTANLIIGSPTVLANSISQSRIGDTFMGCAIGTIIMASSNVMVA